MEPHEKGNRQNVMFAQVRVAMCYCSGARNRWFAPPRGASQCRAACTAFAATPDAHLPALSSARADLWTTTMQPSVDCCAKSTMTKDCLWVDAVRSEFMSLRNNAKYFLRACRSIERRCPLSEVGTQVACTYPGHRRRGARHAGERTATTTRRPHAGGWRRCWNGCCPASPSRSRL